MLGSRQWPHLVYEVLGTEPSQGLEHARIALHQLAAPPVCICSFESLVRLQLCEETQDQS